ncbi:MAG: sulfite exporter TauE/SafE family protein [Gemmatimonadetes bacterium]|nr:sulfite exporter TauE/SafE family protein [Gemmatimonadota bacterium]
MTESVALTGAFLAGLLSFLSPCVLPLVPSYVSFITGLSLEDMAQRRWMAFTHALLFVSGFTIIFTLLGATATALGSTLRHHQILLERIGGGLIILFGLYIMGVFQWGPLARERRFHIQEQPVGYFGSMLVGVAFGVGWSPCIGPILGSILLYTSTQSSVGQGIVLLLVYSLGLAVPFLVAALGVERFIVWFQRYRRFMPLVTKLSGAFMVFVGILVATGSFSRIAGFLNSVTPDFLRSRL